MKKKLLGKCPICGDKLVVSQLHCTNCDTTINGSFELSKFDYLSDEEQKFALVFIKNAGNISQIEKELNISYPTIKKYLEIIQKNLGFIKNEDDYNPKVTREDILARLKNNEISFEKAEEMLQRLGD